MKRWEGFWLPTNSISSSSPKLGFDEGLIYALFVVPPPKEFLSLPLPFPGLNFSTLLIFSPFILRYTRQAMRMMIKMIAATATDIIMTKSPDSQRSFSIFGIKWLVENEIRLTYDFSSNSFILNYNFFLYFWVNLFVWIMFWISDI